MKKLLLFLVIICMPIVTFAAGENIPTSKSYVDSKLGEKQDIIPANDGAARVLTNTGTAGEYGTKGIYDANGEYATQQNNLVDAATMNAGVQNAINTEFRCVEWVDPNDHTSECLLLDALGYSNLLTNPARLRDSTFDPETSILSNTWTTNKNYIRLYLWYADSDNYSSSGQVRITIQNYFRQGQTYKATFTTSSSTHYFYIKHDDSKDIGAYFEIEPSTTYTVIVKALETDLSVVGGMKLQLMLVRGEYPYDDIILPENMVYMP